MRRANLAGNHDGSQSNASLHHEMQRNGAISITYQEMDFNFDVSLYYLQSCA
jgi:hypothetical protein